MSVSDFMSKNVITVQPSATIVESIELMKEHSIHRLPVVKDHYLVGLITEGVIQEALPSIATSLSVFELNYLLNKTAVKDVMIKEIETIEPGALLEDAVSKMRDKNVAVLPVIENKKIVGIITNNDIFDAFLKITGYKDGGTRVSLKIGEDHVGVIAALSKLLAENQESIGTIVVNHLSDATIVEVQVHSKNVHQIRQLFEQAGYNVLDAVLTNQ